MYCNKNLENLLRLILILDADVQSRHLQRQLLRCSLAYYAAHVTKKRGDGLEVAALKGFLDRRKPQRLQLVQQFFTSAGLFRSQQLHGALVVVMSGTHRDIEPRRHFFGDLVPRPALQDVAVANLRALFYFVRRAASLAPPLRLIISDAGLLFFGVVISHGLRFVDLA